IRGSRASSLTTAPRVVIIGCGFGGLWAAQALHKAPVELTVIDRTNHHLFQPLLYQVATAGLSAPAIAAPIRHILRGQRNTVVLMGEVKEIDPAARKVRLDDGGELAYDYLVAAPGSTHSSFGNDAWASYAPGLKTLEDALEIRARILLAYERAERETDPARRAAWLPFVVVGAGAARAAHGRTAGPRASPTPAARPLARRRARPRRPGRGRVRPERPRPPRDLRHRRSRRGPGRARDRKSLV